MAPFVPVPNVVKVSVRGRSSELNWANVLHFVYGGAPPSLPSVTGFASLVFEEYASEIVPLMGSWASLSEVVVTDLSSASSNVGTAGSTTPGTATGEKLPASVAVLASYPTTLRYRGGHPRTYLFCGVQANLEDQSTWTTDFVDTVTSSWGDVLGSLVGETVDGTTYTSQCAVSYRSGGIARETPVVLPISSFTVELAIASQRRRMRRRT